MTGQNRQTGYATEIKRNIDKQFLQIYMAKYQAGNHGIIGSESRGSNNSNAFFTLHETCLRFNTSVFI